LYFRKFNQFRQGRVDTWDYQFTFLFFLMQGRNLIPHKNLVKNAGFEPDATHIRKSIPGEAQLFGTFEEIIHPRDAVFDQAADRRVALEIHRTKRPLMELLSIFFVWRSEGRGCRPEANKRSLSHPGERKYQPCAFTCPLASATTYRPQTVIQHLVYPHHKFAFCSGSSSSAESGI